MPEQIIHGWSEDIRRARSTDDALEIRGGGTKRRYGRQISGTGGVIDTTAWTGLVSYAPEELVVTVRAGTPMAELQAELAEHGQMLPFEPPHFAGGATVGGCVAAGLAGPARPFRGAVRDSVLGVRLLDGQGRHLRFGGQVIKNVAGFDVARFVTGSLGTLGVLTEVSFRLLPVPAYETTLVFELSSVEALRRLNQWRRTAFPVSAAAHLDGRLHVRLSGSEAFVREQAQTAGGSELSAAPAFWQAVRDHQHPFFEPRAGKVLMRLSVRPNAPPQPDADCLTEWGGALRWVWVDEQGVAPARAWANANGGHGTVFDAPTALAEAQGVFNPVPAPQMDLLRRLKTVFDPAGILNPGRMYPNL